MPATFRVDDREQRAFMRRYTPTEIDKVITTAAAAGARAGAKVLKRAAPIGTSRYPSQFYRRMGLGHGAFRNSVGARKVRQRGVNKRTIAYEVGPLRPMGFTRSWIAGGTRPHGGHPGQRANPWFDRADDGSKEAAEVATRRVIEAKARS